MRSNSLLILSLLTASAVGHPLAVRRSTSLTQRGLLDKLLPPKHEPPPPPPPQHEPPPVKHEPPPPPKHEPPKHVEPPKHEPPKHEPPKHEPPKHEPPKHEPPKHEPPKHEPPKHEPPKHEPPKHEPPKHEPPKHEPPKHEPPKHEPPKHEPPKHEPPKHEPPKHEPPKHEPPKHEPPKHEPPKHEPPKHEPPKHEPPKHEPPKHEPPKHEPPKHEQPPHFEPPKHEQPPHFEPPKHEPPKHFEPPKHQPKWVIEHPPKNEHKPKFEFEYKERKEVGHKIDFDEPKHWDFVRKDAKHVPRPELYHDRNVLFVGCGDSDSTRFLDNRFHTVRSVGARFSEFDREHVRFLRFAVKERKARHVVFVGDHECTGIAHGITPRNGWSDDYEKWIRPIRNVFTHSARPEISELRNRINVQSNENDVFTTSWLLKEKGYHALVEEVVKSNIHEASRSKFVVDDWEFFRSNPGLRESPDHDGVFFHGWVWDKDTSKFRDIGSSFGPHGWDIEHLDLDYYSSFQDHEFNNDGWNDFIDEEFARFDRENTFEDFIPTPPSEEFEEAQASIGLPAPASQNEFFNVPEVLGWSSSSDPLL